MNIVCLLGSPRKNGNSATVAEKLLSHARELGAETETIYLNELNYRGCQACYACKNGSEDCVLQDDLTAVLEKVRDADALVLASPVYYGDVSAQLKAFIDRTFCYLKPKYYARKDCSRLEPGKGFAMILIQGHLEEGSFADVFPRYNGFFQWYGYRPGELLRGIGISELSDVTKRDYLMEGAREVAEKLVRGE
jgi:multimeric flavodoxin WrbA